MTSKEALGLLASRVQVGAYKEEMQKCFNIVKKAITTLEERDKPMKVIKTPDWYYHCPRCKYEIDVSNVSFDTKQVYQYCYHCGQRLDW